MTPESYNTTMGVVRRSCSAQYHCSMVSSMSCPMSSENFTYTITLEINKMDAVLGRKLELDVWWTVYKNGRVAVRDRTRLSSPLGDTYEDLAGRQSALINELAGQIAARLAKM